MLALTLDRLLNLRYGCTMCIFYKATISNSLEMTPRKLQAGSKYYKQQVETSTFIMLNNHTTLWIIHYILLHSNN